MYILMHLSVCVYECVGVFMCVSIETEEVILNGLQSVKRQAGETESQVCVSK